MVQRRDHLRTTCAFLPRAKRKNKRTCSSVGTGRHPRQRSSVHAWVVQCQPALRPQLGPALARALRASRKAPGDPTWGMAGAGQPPPRQPGGLGVPHMGQMLHDSGLPLLTWGVARHGFTPQLGGFLATPHHARRSKPCHIFKNLPLKDPGATRLSLLTMQAYATMTVRCMWRSYGGQSRSLGGRDKGGQEPSLPGVVCTPITLCISGVSP